MSKKNKDPNILVLANGSRIDIRSGKRLEDEVTEAVDASASVDSGVEEEGAATPPRSPAPLRSISAINNTRRAYEIKEPPAIMNAVGAVLMYELYGLSSSEIASYLSTSVERIEGIINSDAYITAKAEIIHNVILSMEEDVRGLLATNAKRAAQTVIDGLGSQDSEMKLKAAADVLNRSGFSPQQTILHKHSFEDELIIRHVKTSKGDKMPLIDLEAINA